MNSQVSTAGVESDPKGVGQRARRRVAYRLLPFVFLLYIISYIDRVNVSFANLRMSADLGFSDRVYGLGVGMFYITVAAATFGLINSIGQLGGLAGNYMIGYLNDRTHSLTASFAFIALVYGVAGSLILSLRIRDPIGVLRKSN